MCHVTVVALEVTTGADVIVSVGVGHVVGAVDARGAARPCGLELRTTFLDRDGRGTVLRGKIKTKQNRQQVKQGHNRS